jgi:palmitoyltransferase ZDHHC9/14/18
MTYQIGNKYIICSGYGFVSSEGTGIIISILVFYVMILGGYFGLLHGMGLWASDFNFWFKFGTITSTWLLSICLYLKLAFMDPGIQPPQAATLTENTLEIDVTLNGKPYTTKFCVTCHHRRQPRTKHCNTCGVCVRDYDHHCAFINSCIGQRSRPVFFFYLLSLQLHCLAYLYFSIWDFKIGRVENFTFSNMLMMMISLVLLIYMFGVCLWWYQLFLLSKGITQYEFNTDAFEETGNPFDRGCWKNFVSGLCPTVKKSEVKDRRYSVNLSMVGGMASSSAIKLDPKDLMHCEDLGRSNYTIQHSVGHKGTLHWVGKLLAVDKMKLNSDGVELTNRIGTPQLQTQMLERESISSQIPRTESSPYIGGSHESPQREKKGSMGNVIPRTESSPYIGGSHESPQREKKGSMGNVLESRTAERDKNPKLVRLMTSEI